MYYCFKDLNRAVSRLLLNYFIDTEPIIIFHCLDKGFEDYALYTLEFVQRALGPDISKYTLKQCLEELEEKEYIFIHRKFDKYGKEITAGERYIKLNKEKIFAAMGVRTDIQGYDTIEAKICEDQHYGNPFEVF